MILVTGATGHIGNVLVKELLAQRCKVRVFVHPRDDLTSIQGLPLEILVGDVRNPRDLQKAVQDVETVFHLAGMISIMPGQGKLLEEVNLQGTRNILEASGSAGVSKLVYTSSIHALGRVPHGKVVDESAGFALDERMGEYDRTKALASLEVVRAAREGLDAVIVCPTGVIGPYDFRLSEMGTLILNTLRSRTSFSIEGAYDFVDVRDVVSGQILAWEKGLSGETYILSGNWIRIEDLIQTVRRISGNAGRLIRVPAKVAAFMARYAPAYYRLSGSRPQFTPYSIDTVRTNAVISHDKATAHLGYSHRTLVESLSDTIQWFRESIPGLKLPATTNA